MNKTKYVLGFVVDEELTSVVMMRKNRPELLAGKLNGLGGKIEEGETSLEAVRREVEEEGGVYIDRWELQGNISGDDYDIDIYSAIYDDLSDFKTKTDEEVTVYKVDALLKSEMVEHVPEIIQNIISFYS